MLLEGKQFSHYRILRLIGRGGMGEVYLAEDTQIMRQVASKFIRIETEIPDQEAVARALRLFWREATAIASLDHANILPLLDHGETTLDDFPLAYLVMPYRPEGSLTTWLRQRGRDQQTQQLSLRQIGHIVQQASLALQYAHDHQIIHLDVKPANFLVRSRSTNDEYPDLLLSDFGIARLASATSSLSQHVRGTPTYMAPEQWANQPVFASDQYALAIMVYELLTGNPPFRGAPMNVMYAHIHELPRSVCDLNPRLPTAIDLILQRALAKKPDERYSSITEFAQAFQHVPGAITLEMDKSVTPLPSQPDSSNTVLGNYQFALPLTPIPLPTPLDTLPRLPLPLQDFPSSSLAIPKQTDFPAQNSDSPSKDLPVPVAISAKSSDSLPTPQTTPTNFSPALLTTPPAVITQPARRRPRVVVIGLLLLSLLVLVGASIGAYSTIISRWPGQNVQKKTVLQGPTPTTGATITVTSQINKGSATATATATAQKTSTPNSSHAYPTYLPGHGTFALFDPLSQPDYWHNQADSDTNG
ncbi:MAG TPA: serine/threonine-protein kinase, partial [Ktedonobacteraceae bacterium]